MKQIPLILSIVSILAVIAMAVVMFTSTAQTGHEMATSDSTKVAANTSGIAYIQLDRVIAEYDRYNDMKTAIETKADGIQSDIDRRGKQFESEVTTFQDKVSKGLMTRSVAEAQQMDLAQKEQELNTYVYQKQQELQEETFVMNNNIMEDIRNYVARYNESKNYSVIFTTDAATNTIILGNAALDISDDIIAGLNEEYTSNKKK